MVYFLRSWWDSLSTFWSPQVGLFLLGLLQLIRLTWIRVLVSWLLLVLVLATLFYTSFFVCLPPLWGPVCLAVKTPWILVLSWIFFLYATFRASIKLKTWGYYYGYRWHWGWFMLACWLFIFLACYLFVTPLFLEWLLLPIWSSASLLGFLHTPFLGFFILFLLDSDGSVADLFLSLWRSFLMIFYNLPFCFITLFLIRLLFGIVRYFIFWTWLPFIIEDYVLLLFLPIPLYIWTVFYTKRLHEQFGWYFSDTNRG